MRHQIKSLVILLGIGIFGVVSFSAGVAIGNANLLTPCVVPAAGQPPQFALFWQTWNLVQRDFVDRKALDTTEMVYGAIRGMVEALGDTGHTTFLTPEEKASRDRSLAGQFTGIGAELGLHNGVPVIVAAFDGSPAQQAGVRAGDVILKIKGDNAHALTLSQISAKVRGPT